MTLSGSEGYMEIDLIIPTYKPKKTLLHLLEMIEKQTHSVNRIILMNTEEKYMIPFEKENDLRKRFPKVEIYHVTETEFDHGNTRHQGVLKSQAPYFLCMTDDAVPEDVYLIENLLKHLQQESIAVAYGRQLPAADCGITERFIRQFNYPSESRIKKEDDKKELGIKTYFCSNVCAAYNRSIYDSLGGFIRHTIFNEDMIYAGTALQHGYQIAYAADAKVVHSHNYNGLMQLKRNFDLGVSQADHPEIFANVPSEKEGGKLVKSTLHYLLRKRRLDRVIPFIYQCGCKWIGYRLGKSYRKLPKKIIRKLTMNRNYWIES